MCYPLFIAQFVLFMNDFPRSYDWSVTNCDSSVCLFVQYCVHLNVSWTTCASSTAVDAVRLPAPKLSPPFCRTRKQEVSHGGKTCCLYVVCEAIYLLKHTVETFSVPDFAKGIHSTIRSAYQSMRLSKPIITCMCRRSKKRYTRIWFTLRPV